MSNVFDLDEVRVYEIDCRYRDNIFQNEHFIRMIHSTLGGACSMSAEYAKCGTYAEVRTINADTGELMFAAEYGVITWLGNIGDVAIRVGEGD